MKTAFQLNIKKSMSYLNNRNKDFISCYFCKMGPFHNKNHTPVCWYEPFFYVHKHKNVKYTAGVHLLNQAQDVKYCQAAILRVKANITNWKVGRNNTEDTTCTIKSSMHHFLIGHSVRNQKIRRVIGSSIITGANSQLCTALRHNV